MMNIKKDIYVIDLFCGMGGFSEGARQAGAKVILAVDNWKGALEVHKNNHPETVHWDLTLGGDVSEFCNKLNSFIEENVPKGNHLHIHGSPPCQNLSRVNVLRDVEKGSILVEWYINLLPNINRINTWSMEQVLCKYTKELLDIHGGCLVEMRKFGVHNDRKRIFLGNFNDFTNDENTFSEPYTLQEVLNITNEPYEGFRQQTTGSSNKRKIKTTKFSCRELDLLSYTVTGKYPQLYNKYTGITRVLSLRAFSFLQTFPNGYIDDNHGKKDGRQMIGNSVPPRISKILIEHLGRHSQDNELDLTKTLIGETNLN